MGWQPQPFPLQCSLTRIAVRTWEQNDLRTSEVLDDKVRIVVHDMRSGSKRVFDEASESSSAFTYHERCMQLPHQLEDHPTFSRQVHASDSAHVPRFACQRKHRRGRLLRDRPPLGTRLLIPPLPLVGALRDAIALGGQTICVCVMMQTTPDARRDRIRFFYWGKHRTDLVAGMGVGNVVSNLDCCDSSRRSGIKLHASTLLASH